MGMLNLAKVFQGELTAKIMVTMIILFLFVLAFCVFLHFYAKYYIRRSKLRRLPAIRRPFDVESSPISAVHCGLDPMVLESIPVLSCASEDHETGIECAVCLSEVSEGEKYRLLPKCHHRFHVDCIDMWFHSHSTCPICRNPIQNQPATIESILQATASSENNMLPTNVPFLGNYQAQVSIHTVSTALNADGDENTTRSVTIEQVVVEDELDKC